MNGNGRLYRSTSEAMLGGVAAGLGNYFRIDPTFLRLAFIVLGLASGGAFVVFYLAMWLLIPTAGSTATEPGQIVQENLNDIGERARKLTGMGSNGNPAGAQGNGGSANPNGGSAAASVGYEQSASQAQLPQGGTAARQRQGVSPAVLIAIGLFFLMANFGFFHGVRWGMWWPLLLIGLGAIMLSRRNQA
jgi:phage shock protein PspC (stress-responsive transcriptional regulator)